MKQVFLLCIVFITINGILCLSEECDNRKCVKVCGALGYYHKGHCDDQKRCLCSSNSECLTTTGVLGLSRVDKCKDSRDWCPQKSKNNICLQREDTRDFTHCYCESLQENTRVGGDERLSLPEECDNQKCVQVCGALGYYHKGHCDDQKRCLCSSYSECLTTTGVLGLSRVDKCKDSRNWCPQESKNNICLQRKDTRDFTHCYCESLQSKTRVGGDYQPNNTTTMAPGSNFRS